MHEGTSLRQRPDGSAPFKLAGTIHGLAALGVALAVGLLDAVTDGLLPTAALAAGALFAATAALARYAHRGSAPRLSIAILVSMLPAAGTLAWATAAALERQLRNLDTTRSLDLMGEHLDPK